MIRKTAILTVLVTTIALGAFATPANAVQGTWMHKTCSNGGHTLTTDTHYYEYYNYDGSITRVFDQIKFKLSESGSSNNNNFNAWISQGNNTYFWYYSPDNILSNTDYVLDILPNNPGFQTSAQNSTTFTFQAIFDVALWPDPDCTATLVVPPRPQTQLYIGSPGTPTNTVNTPVSVTMYAGGGYAPYHFTSTALPAGLSLNGSTGVISGTPTVTGTTSVTVTVTDAYSYTASTTFNWVINPPPPPPLSVSISGPGAITAKGTYTFSAVYSGFNASPGFAWSERFCSDSASTNCSSWVAISGVGASFNRTLNKDCSGIGENSYQLALTMTNSNGATASTNHTSYLCELA